MPQDELWACSARLTGYQFSYHFDGPSNEKDLFVVRTMWSKEPSIDRQGHVTIDIDPAYRWHAISLMNVAGGELLGGYARNVPGVVRAELRRIQAQFQEGSLH